MTGTTKAYGRLGIRSNRAALVALVLTGGVLFPTAARAQPALGPPRNLDFEGVPGPKGLPEGWGGGGAEYELATDTKVVHTGKQSGRITYTGANDSTGAKSGTLTQVISPDPLRGRRVRFSGFVRTERVEGDGAALWMRVDGPPGNRGLAFDNMMDRALTGMQDWKKCTIVLDVPQEAKSIAFGMLVAGTGTAWVDDLKLETVGANVPTTDLVATEATRNMDFEAPARGSGQPPAWGGSGEDYEITVDDQIAHSGKQSGRVGYVSAGEPGRQAFGTLARTVDARPYRGGRVRLTGYVRTDAVDWAGLWLRVDGPEKGKSLAFDNMKTSNRAITGTTDWKQYEIVLDVPQQATQISFGMLVAGRGTGWLDDVKLEQASPR